MDCPQTCIPSSCPVSVWGLGLPVFQPLFLGSASALSRDPPRHGPRPITAGVPRQAPWLWVHSWGAPRLPGLLGEHRTLWPRAAGPISPKLWPHPLASGRLPRTTRSAAEGNNALSAPPSLCQAGDSTLGPLVTVSDHVQPGEWLDLPQPLP